MFATEQDGSLFSISSAWGVAALSDGSVVLAGTTDGDYAETNAGAQDFAVVKLTEEGVLDWTWQVWSLKTTPKALLFVVSSIRLLVTALCLSAPHSPAPV